MHMQLMITQLIDITAHYDLHVYMSCPHGHVDLQVACFLVHVIHYSTRTFVP